MPAIIKPRGLDPTRRRALLQIAMGGSAFGIAGCGEQAKAQLPEVCTQDGADAAEGDDRSPLSSQLIMEWLVVDAYGALSGAPYGQEVKDAFELFGSHHAEHAAWAKTHYETLGLELPERSPLPALPDACFEDDRVGLRLVLAAETDAVVAYQGVIKQMMDPERRRVAASILGTEMSHVMALRAALLAPDGLALASTVANIPFADAEHMPVDPAYRICEMPAEEGE